MTTHETEHGPIQRLTSGGLWGIESDSEESYFVEVEGGRSSDYSRYQRLSKADWADAYADLYAQVFGVESAYDDILKDAEHRVDNLRRQGIR